MRQAEKSKEREISAALKAKDSVRVQIVGVSERARLIVSAFPEAGFKEKLPQVIVISWKREKAIQLADAVKALANGSTSIGTFIGGTILEDDLKVLRRMCHMAIGTPGRLCNLLERGDLVTPSLKLMVLDDAENLMRDPFRADVFWIHSLVPQCPIMAFVTEASNMVEEGLRSIKPDGRSFSLVGDDLDRNSVQHYYTVIEGESFLEAKSSKMDILQKLLKEGHKQTVVYCESPGAACLLATYLRELHIDLVIISGEDVLLQHGMHIPMQLFNFRHQLLIVDSSPAKQSPVAVFGTPALIVHYHAPATEEIYSRTIPHRPVAGLRMITFLAQAHQDTQRQLLERACGQQVKEIELRDLLSSSNEVAFVPESPNAAQHQELMKGIAEKIGAAVQSRDQAEEAAGSTVGRVCLDSGASPSATLCQQANGRAERTRTYSPPGIQPGLHYQSLSPGKQGQANGQQVYDSRLQGDEEVQREGESLKLAEDQSHHPAKHTEERRICSLVEEVLERALDKAFDPTHLQEVVDKAFVRPKPAKGPASWQSEPQDSISAVQISETVQPGAEPSPLLVKRTPHSSDAAHDSQGREADARQQATVARLEEAGLSVSHQSPARMAEGNGIVASVAAQKPFAGSWADERKQGSGQESDCTPASKDIDMETDDPPNLTPVETGPPVVETALTPMETAPTPMETVPTSVGAGLSPMENASHPVESKGDVADHKQQNAKQLPHEMLQDVQALLGRFSSKPVRVKARQAPPPSLLDSAPDEFGRDMNDAEIEAAILRKHQARISEEADAAIPDTSLEEADLELDDSQTVYELQADHQQETLENDTQAEAQAAYEAYSPEEQLALWEAYYTAQVSREDGQDDGTIWADPMEAESHETSGRAELIRPANDQVTNVAASEWDATGTAAGLAIAEAAQGRAMPGTVTAFNTNPAGLATAGAAHRLATAGAAEVLATQETAAEWATMSADMATARIAEDQATMAPDLATPVTAAHRTTAGAREPIKKFWNPGEASVDENGFVKVPVSLLQRYYDLESQFWKQM